MNSKKTFIILSLLLLGIGSIYFNATTFPGRIYLGCNGNGNADENARIMLDIAMLTAAAIARAW